MGFWGAINGVWGLLMGFWGAINGVLGLLMVLWGRSQWDMVVFSWGFGALGESLWGFFWGGGGGCPIFWGSPLICGVPHSRELSGDR